MFDQLPNDVSLRFVASAILNCLSLMATNEYDATEIDE